jgi:predicted phosphodiesterase
MRILVISDIHANLSALDAVLADAGEFDTVWCLGDLVGYGPDPNECIARIQQLPSLQCIIGNHDAAVIGSLDTNVFNIEAQMAIFWTRNVLTEMGRVFLKQLPQSLTLDHVTLAHGSPRHPVWEYLLDSLTASQNFDYFRSPYCFVGHTHLPVIFHLAENHDHAHLSIPEQNQIVYMMQRSILNPGSVGQPRDRDPRAAYAVYDPENFTWSIRRIPYDIKSVQARMKEAGLPDKHIHRITTGW